MHAASCIATSRATNIMLTESEHVKVMDFGLALISSPDAETLRRIETAAPRIAGTPPYMAPELWRGHEASTSWISMRSGIVLFEMATGTRPFAGRTDAALITAIMADDPHTPKATQPFAPRWISDLILVTCCQEAHRRPRQQPAIVVAIHALLDSPRKQNESSALSRCFGADSAPPQHDPENAHLGVGLADAITSELALVRSGGPTNLGDSSLPGIRTHCEHRAECGILRSWRAHLSAAVRGCASPFG